jgi:sulfite exporter TauE/SafE/copper chaperone CopZ
MINKFIETFTVRGMSCTGCEAVIEKALTGLDGIFNAKASFSKNQVTVTYDPRRVGFVKMIVAAKKAGYSIEKMQDKPVKEVAGKDRPISALQFAGIAVVLLAVYLIINNTVGFNFIPEITPSMGYGVLFVVGLLTSLHCVAMCGGINISQCVNGGGTAAGVRNKIGPSLLYNLGRVISYTVIGAIIGAVGSGISLSGWARGLVAILSGIFMIIMGLSMTGMFPWMNRITPRLPRIFREKADSAGKGKGPFVVGLLNGFMPCGPLQAMQVYALGAGSLIAGALSMFFFSLGTLPLMFGLGAVMTMLGRRFTKKMMKASAVLVAVLGIVMLGRGLVLSGVDLPVLSSASASSSGFSSGDSASVEDGVQNVTSTLASGGYPDITVQEGIPVVWNLQADSGTLNGCNRTLVIPEYDLQVNLKAGDNIIEFTPTKSGKITYSCWMGMQTGQIDVVDDLNGKTAQSASDEAAASSSGAPSGGMSCCTGG